MAGFEVNRSLLDQKSAEAVLVMRDAVSKSETIFNWLADNPADALTQPVESGGFGYTNDEAYLIKTTFENLHALNIQPILDVARRLTGLN